VAPAYETERTIPQDRGSAEPEDSDEEPPRPKGDQTDDRETRRDYAEHHDEVGTRVDHDGDRPPSELPFPSLFGGLGRFSHHSRRRGRRDNSPLQRKTLKIIASVGPPTPRRGPRRSRATGGAQDGSTRDSGSRWRRLGRVPAPAPRASKPIGWKGDSSQPRRTRPRETLGRRVLKTGNIRPS
jgi:hypothetical protein